MRYLVLGPLELHGDNGPIATGSPKERRLLAMLIAKRREVVSVDCLIDGIWEGSPPRSAAKTLQGYVVHVRHTLVAAGGSQNAIVTSHPGYSLKVAPGEVDADQFVDLTHRGRQAAEAGDHRIAKALLEEALDLWRGSAYADFDRAGLIEADGAHLEELRLLSLETRIAADLAIGRGADLLPELETAVALHPTRERFWVQLMHALYRSGRQADALATFQRVRNLLREELGIEPGDELRSMHAAVLAQDPGLTSLPLLDWHPLFPGVDQSVPSFEGRSEDMRWLQRHWVQTIAGRGNVVVVSGPPGIGKSRLLAEFGLEAHRQGGAVSYDVATRAPSPASLLAAARGRPALALLDEPLTAVSQTMVRGHPLLVVAALDTSRASRHVRSGFLDAEHRQIAPLSDECARRVIDSYPGVEGEVIDAQRVLRASGGVPGRLHQLIATEVERSAMSRIGVAAEAAGVARASLSAIRDDLRTGILDLQRGRFQQAAHTAHPLVSDVGGSTGRCPFKGLAPFEREDFALFHGRDSLIASLLSRVADTSLVAVIGASGSGKSSLVRAGLLASLADGSLPGSSDWRQHLLIPGDVLPSPHTEPMVVVVDQFEETWTGLDADARAGFLDEVVGLSTAGHRVIITLRGDYAARCAEHPAFATLVGEGTVLVGPMTVAEIRRAVVGPARAAGLVVEPELVDAVVGDVRAQPGSLPMMSAALVDTWEGRSGRRLTVAAYRQAGGVAGAVARIADAAFESLNHEERAAVRRLFLRLASSGDEEVLVRRRVSLAEVHDDVATSRALDVMRARRLLTFDRGAVEVAHEALFHAWPRLAGWLADDQQGRHLRRHLAPAALDWAAGQRSTADLYRGVRLDAVVEWSRQHRDDLTQLEREFVDASAFEADRELRSQHERADRESRGRKRLRMLVGVIALSLVATGVAAVIAVGQKRHVDDIARRAIARQLGSAALVEDSLDRSLLLAAAAVRVDDSVETRGDLLAALQRSPAAIQVLRGDGDRLLAMDIIENAHGSTAVVGDDNGTITTWDTNARRQSAPAVQATTHGFAEIVARPGTDEVTLSSLGTGGPQVPLLIRWDPVAQRRIGRPLTGARTPMDSLAWSPDGRWLAANQDVGDVLVWDFRHLDRPPIHIRTNHDRFRKLAYVGDRQFLLVEESGAAAVWRPGAQQPIRQFDVGGAVSTTASTADGSLVAVGHAGGEVALWDPATGRLMHRLTSHTAVVGEIVFDRLGETVATLGDDSTVQLSAVGSGTLQSRLNGHAGAVTAGAFTADGRILYTSSLDGSVMAWDVTGARSLGAYFPTSRGVESTSTQVSRDGVVAQTHADGTVRYWDGDVGRPLGKAVDGDQQTIIDAAFSPDGSELATAAVGGTVQIWDATRRLPGALISGLPGDANEIRYSPDGRLLAVCVWKPESGTIHLIDTVTSIQVGETIDIGWGVTQLAWSPDSTAFAVASWEVPDVKVYDAHSHEPIWSQQVDRLAASLSVAWSPDGAQVATGDELGRLRMWDAASGQPQGVPLTGHTGAIVTTAFSADGRLLASAGFDGRVILRDAATGTQLGLPLAASDNRMTMARFDASGQLFVASEDGSIWRWDVDIGSWLRRACTVAGRELSRAEWADLDTGQDYQPACA